MQPALSVIFFTVTAGTGYGLLILLAFARSLHLVETISPDQIVVTGLAGLVLVTAGLLASTLHLANPKNAWRSFSRFRTSWLSREAVFAVAFYPLALAWLAAEWFTGNSILTSFLGYASAGLAAIVLVCTAMIYASLKTIRQWHTPFVPANFVLLALVTGAFAMLMFASVFGLPAGRLILLALAFVIVAALVKLGYFAWIGQPAGPTINDALGFTQASLRLFDLGHSSHTFHTREFGFEVARARLIWLRAACIALTFALPSIALLLVVDTQSGAGVPVLPAVLAMASAYAGAFIERWLFFAEARHVVNLYHGAQRT